MRRLGKTKIGYVLLLLMLVWTTAACSYRLSWGTPDHAPRPIATSTPDPAVQTGGTQAGGALLKPAPTATPIPTNVDVTTLSTAEQLALVVAPTRDLRDLALRYRPDVGEIPLVVSSTVPAYAVGDRLEFWAHDMQENRDFMVTAELIHKAAVAYVWVEVDQPVDRDKIIAAVDRFSRQSYPAVTAFFGSEWNPGVDNDPRLHILHATGLGSNIAGYYSSADQYSELARPRSNQKEMFYINLGWLNRAQDYTYYETVLAHEFQHMIHWYKDRNEETWVNEGLSELAQDVADYAPNTSFARDFADAPDTQLNTWNEVSGGNDVHYGSSYLFMAYFAQRFGPELTRALVAHPSNGVRGFEAVLAGAGQSVSFNDLFAEWVVANYTDDPYALGRENVYGYRSFDQAPPRLDTVHDQYPTAERATTVANYGTDYVLLEGEGDVVLHFAADTTTRLADLTPASGEKAWWSHRGDDFNTRLTRRFDLAGVSPGDAVEMTAALWWDIEDHYDFGYVSVSRDGRTWELLPGDSTVLDTENVGALGPGYTGSSNGWRTERFDLSPFAGAQIYVRFEYVTDDAINTRGWFVDDIAIPAIDYASDFEQGADGWESEGWLLTDNQLPQGWIVQVLALDDNVLAGVERVEVGADGRAAVRIPGLGDGRTAVVAISGAALVTTEPAAYSYWIDQP